MRSDSYSIKTLSVLAMIFLPISTVSSIFGTEFFSTEAIDDSDPGSPATYTTYVSSRFWVFWVVAVPVTLFCLLGWGLWMKLFHPKARKVRRRPGIQKGAGSVLG